MREQYFVFLKKLANALNSGTMTGAVKNVVESRQVVLNTYVIPELITMEYFGYLHHDPDVIGYQNRVNTLGSDPSDYRHMLFGFIYSTDSARLSRTRRIREPADHIMNWFNHPRSIVD